MSTARAHHGVMATLAGWLGVPVAAVLPLLLLTGGWLVMFVPAYHGLANTIWAGDEQGHGPIILAVSLWLLYAKRQALAELPRQPATLAAVALLLLGIASYALGRSQVIWTLEIGAQIIVLVALLLLFFGAGALRVAWFPLFFLIFMIPWPGDWVAVVTAPLKAAVSSVAADLLHMMGYPVGRSGVILTVGPYQ